MTNTIPKQKVKLLLPDPPVHPIDCKLSNVSEKVRYKRFMIYIEKLIKNEEKQDLAKVKKEFRTAMDTVEVSFYHSRYRNTLRNLIVKYLSP